MWNTFETHSLLLERERWREHSLHRDKLDRIRNRRKITALPYSPVRNPRKLRLQQEKAHSIQRENELLLQKIVDIDLKPALPLPLPLISSLNRRNRIQELTKISRENQAMLKRLKRTQSSYSAKRLLDQSDTLTGLCMRLSQNAGRIPRVSTYDADWGERSRRLSRHGSVEGRRGRPLI